MQEGSNLGRELQMADEVSRCFVCLPKTSTYVFDFGNRNRIEAIRKGFTVALKKAGDKCLEFCES
jgi:hypothetical protein